MEWDNYYVILYLMHELEILCLVIVGYNYFTVCILIFKFYILFKISY